MEMKRRLSTREGMGAAEPPRGQSRALSPLVTGGQLPYRIGLVPDGCSRSLDSPAAYYVN